MKRTITIEIEDTTRIGEMNQNRVEIKSDMSGLPTQSAEYIKSLDSTDLAGKIALMVESIIKGGVL